jgi:FkbM family methyltransferase
MKHASMVSTLAGIGFGFAFGAVFRLDPSPLLEGSSCTSSRKTLGRAANEEGTNSSTYDTTNLHQADNDGNEGVIVDPTTSCGSPSESATSQNKGKKAKSYDLSYHPTTLLGHQYFLPDYAMHRPAVKKFLRGKYFEPETHRIVQALLSQYPGSMVHAGTFFGDMVPHFATLVGSSGTLYAFEPNTKNYLLAQMAVEHNELSNVVLVNAALGRDVRQQRMLTQIGAEGLGGSSNVNENGEMRIPQVTIDMFGITNLSIIELDVEGFEGEALNGALQTIQREKPIVAIEDNRRTGGPVLANLGYKKVCRVSGLLYWAHPDKVAEVKHIVCR